MNKFVLLLPLLLLMSCKALKTNSNPAETLATIGNEAIPTREFMYIYKKNNFNNDSLDRREDINHYLDLFINFKLKVKEAEALGLHNTDAFKKELEGYRKLLAKPYLTENNVTEKLIKEAYERLKTEIKASHILISVPPHAAPEDTLKAYQKIKKIRERALNGESFEKLSGLYSDDPSAKKNGGSLGYFTALQMVYPFEDAAYQTEVGAISPPIRTKFGYHIIKVDDKRPSQGKVKIAHIMIRATEGLPAEDSIAAREKAFEIYHQLQQKANWREMVRQFSDDLSTKSSEGVLPWFGTGNMIPAIEEAAFALDSIGDISKPVKSPYGWHIIRLEGRRDLEPFEVVAPSIKMKVSKDSRSELNKAALIKRLKVENEFIEYEQTIDKAILAADSALNKGTWSFDTATKSLNELIFKLKEEEYTLKDFFEFVKANQKARPEISPETYMKILYDDYAVESILAYEEAHLADKYEDYRMLLKEYRDGILLFELMDKKVWSKAIEDTAGLRDFFNANRDKYQWGERVKATIYSAANEKVLERLKPMLQKDQFSDPQNKEALEELFNKNKPLTLEIEAGIFEKGDNVVIDKIKWAPGAYTIDYDERTNYVVVDEILEGGPKKLSETRGKAISDYQAYLEKQWVQALKEKYPVQVNSKALEKIYQTIENEQ